MSTHPDDFGGQDFFDPDDAFREQGLLTSREIAAEKDPPPRMTRTDYMRRSDLWNRLGHQLAGRCATALYAGDIDHARTLASRRWRALEHSDACWFMATSELVEVPE